MTAPSGSGTDERLEVLIEEFFAGNLRELEAEKGHALAPGVRDAALNQVKLYYRRLKDIAERVTDTEVKLSLPGQRTPAHRGFTIEGVVDIVREQDRTVLYDIKTHDADEIRANLPEYERQLNVYAHIWQELRGEQLDELAVICTRYPRAVEAALVGGSEEALGAAMTGWDPVIPIPLSRLHIEETIAEFGRTVDLIEEHRFDPPPRAALAGILPGMKARFAVAVCRNCDARFSCTAWRDYALQSTKGSEALFREYLDDLGDDVDVEESRAAALEVASPAIDDLV
jgi:hypothetical protein